MPTFKSGLGSQLTFGKETTYGTAVARAKSVEYRSESMDLKKDFLRSQQLKAGAMFQTASRRVATTRQAAGGIVLEVPNKDFGLILDQLHGNAVTPVQQAASIAWLQTHNIGTTDPSGKSLTVQLGKPDVGGTVRPFTYKGVKVLGATFRVAVGEFLVCELTLDAQDEDTATALDTFAPSTSLRSFDFTQLGNAGLGAFTIDGSPAGVVKGFEIPITLPYATDRFGLGTVLKGAPIINGYPDISPKVDVEFTDMTQYTKFQNGAVAAIVADFQGPIIASTFREQIKFTISAAGINGDTPQVSGPDLLVQSIPFEVLDDGTNPPLKVEYMSYATTAGL